VAGTGFKEIEARLVLTADTAKMRRGMDDARRQVKDLGATAAATTAMMAMQGARLGMDAMQWSLNLAKDDWDALRKAAASYNAEAIRAGASADVAQMKLEMSQARAAGPDVARAEATRERIANYSAEHAYEESRFAVGYGEGESLAKAAFAAAKKNIGGASAGDVVRSALSLGIDSPIRSRMEQDVTDMTLGGAKGVKVDTGAVIVQVLRDILSAVNPGKQGGG
jgi:hypothetical protein